MGKELVRGLYKTTQKIMCLTRRKGTMKNDEIVKKICPCCGRDMQQLGRSWVCTNSLCDYEEDYWEEEKDER
jgi:hypothetical protein